MSNKLTAGEVANSLTGYDEIAIENSFGAPVADLFNNKPTTAARALIFVLKRREGLADSAAKKAVMELTIGQLDEFFEPEVEEVMPDDPFHGAGETDSA